MMTLGTLAALLMLRRTAFVGDEWLHAQ